MDIYRTEIFKKTKNQGKIGIFLGKSKTLGNLPPANPCK